MKGFITLALTMAASSVVLAPTNAAMCDMGAIKALVPKNQTDNLDTCTLKVDWDLFKIEKYPTREQAYQIQHSTSCTNAYNSIQWSSNDQRRCNVTIGPDSIYFGYLLDSVLNGRTGNKTMYNDTSLSKSSSDSGSSYSDSGSASGTNLTANSTNKTNTGTGGSSMASTTSLAAATSLAISFVALAFQF